MRAKNLYSHFQEKLNGEKLHVADVGSTGGVEERWKPLLELCHFYTFDPDPRAKKWDIHVTNFPFGLWSNPCHKTLYLKNYPPASSLFETFDAEIVDFGLEEALKTVSKKEISLEKLDNVLQDKPLDFLKIDAEGAELEILKGAEKSLEKIFGLQLETFFLPLRKDAPLFADIALYLKDRGFYPYQLNREHWIRKNGTYTHKSSPQLIWANALFFPTKKLVMEKIESQPEQEVAFLKFILILLSYRLYDYAYSLCEERKDFALCSLIKEACKKPPFFTSKLLLSLICGSGKYLLALSPEKKGRQTEYLKRKMRELGTYCLSLGKNQFAVYDDS